MVEFTREQIGLLNSVRLLRDQKRSIDAEITEILLELAPVYDGEYNLGKSVAGSMVVDVQRNAVWNVARARAELSDDDWNRILVPTPSSAAAKALFPDRYDKMQKVGTNKVLISLPDDEE